MTRKPAATSSAAGTAHQFLPCLCVFCFFLTVAPAKSADLPITRVEASFASIGENQDACETPQLFFQGDIRPLLPNESIKRADSLIQSYNEQLKTAKELRDKVDESRDNMRLAILGVLRLVEEASQKMVEDFEKGSYFTALWEAAELRYNVGKAEDEAINALIVYYWHLWDLTSAQEALRTTETQYYELVGAVYPALNFGRRAVAIEAFQKRMKCLKERREQVFCLIAKNRREFWKNFNDRFWTTISGGEWSPVTEEKHACGVEPEANRNTGNEDENDPMAELADAFLSSTRLDEEYSFLAPETTSAASILSSMLTREEDAVRNAQLKELIDEALGGGVNRDGAELLAYQPMSQALRVKVFQMRVERAQLALDRKLVALEAAHRKQASVMLGLGESFSKAGHQVAVTAGLEGDALQRAWETGKFTPRGLATAEEMKAFEPQLKIAALLAITQKLLGDSFSLMITTPLQDAITEIALKPAWGAWGGEIKTSVEKAWDAHVQQEAELKRRQGVLADLKRNVTSQSAATSYLKAFAGGDPNASPIGSRAPTTVRGLLEDSDFIAATKGGLPWLFEAFAEIGAQRAALLLYGASYELEAIARTSAVRIAAMRGLPVENPDLKLTRASFQEIFKPDKLPPSLTASSDSLIDLVPVLGDIKRLYNLPATVSDAIDLFYGNIQDQNAHLEELIRYQQSFTRVIQALAACDFDYNRFQRERPDIYATDHMELLGGSSAYANAYRLIRYHEKELEKRLVVARHFDPARQKLSPRGKLALTAIQSQQDMESAALAVRAALATLANHSATGNYAAAAAQVRSIEQLEARRRKLFDLAPPTVDLSGVAHAYESEAARREMVQVYAGLYKSALKDVVMTTATDALSDSIMDAITERIGIRFIAEAGNIDAGAKIYDQLNPWAGLFSTEGIFNTLQGGFEGAAKTSTAQMLAARQNMFTEGEIEEALDVVYSIARDVASNTRNTVLEGTPERVLDRSEAEAREAALLAGADALEAYHQREIEPLYQRLEQIGDDPDFEFQREQIIRQIEVKEQSPEALQLREHLAALAADANESYERRLEAESEEAEAASQIAAKFIESEARQRSAAADDDSDDAIRAARAAAAAETLSRLKSDSVDVADLRRLTDPDDPVDLKSRLLSPELDIETIRNALKRAKRNNPDRAAEIDSISTAIDRRRIELVQDLINQFMKESDLGRKVVAIVQGGAAEGNPEYQGIFGDIDFTIFVVPGADDNAIKKQILDFFRERDFPLATQEERSSMDTETFVQPAGRLEASETPYRVLLLDAAVKRKDATRFFSEGGGKWAMNNYAFSGKPLWGDIGEIRKWVRVEPREGYGLALDMARHLGFISDPRKTPGALGRMSPEQRVEQLNGVLKDSKYFLRLVDAYLMGHEGLGNSLYNNRMQWRADSGENASYHAQIAKDVEALVMAGGGGEAKRLTAVTGGLEGDALDSAKRTIFDERDLGFIRMLAEMKQKGANPDPWGVVDGDSTKAAELAAWMQELAPRILAETADVWQREHERVMAEGNPDAIRAVRTDARRIATTAAAADLYDTVGARAMLRPPARIIDGTDANGRPRMVEQRLSKQEHLDQLRRGIQLDRQRRQGMLQEIAARQAEIRQKYPPEEEMTDAERAAAQAEMKAVYDLVEGRAQNAEEDSSAKWMMFWMRR